MKAALLLMAAMATIYAAASFITGFDGDFKVSALIAALCLGAVFWLDHCARERERMAHGREMVWRRRDAEQRVWDDIDEYLREVD